MTPIVWRRITGVRGLDGLRRALFAAALLSLLSVAVGTTFAPPDPARWDGAGTASVLVLAGCWWRLFRTRRPSVLFDAIEAFAVFGLATAFSADYVMPVFFCGAVLRAAYGSRARALTGGITFALA